MQSKPAHRRPQAQHAPAGERPGSVRPVGGKGKPGTKLHIGFVAGLVVAATLSYAAVLAPVGPLAMILDPVRDGHDAARIDDPVDPAERLSRYLVRSTLMALDDANRTNNYSVLRLLASPSFQANNSAARLAELFRAQRDKHFDLSVAAYREPRWKTRPAVGDDRLLRLVGAYPQPDGALRFALAFEAHGGVWRLLELHVAMQPHTTRAAGLH